MIFLSCFFAQRLTKSATPSCASSPTWLPAVSNVKLKRQKRIEATSLNRHRRLRRMKRNLNENMSRCRHIYCLRSDQIGGRNTYISRLACSFVNSFRTLDRERNIPCFSPYQKHRHSSLIAI